MAQGRSEILKFYNIAPYPDILRSSTRDVLHRYLEDCLSSLTRLSILDPRVPGTGAGITEPMIERLVAEFYRRVRQDRLLGPIFDAAVEDWDRHLSRMRDFWSSVVLMSGRYKGKPVLVHAMLPGIIPAHFRQWLALFDKTASEVCQAKAAAHINDRARRIAESLHQGTTIHRAAAGDPLAFSPASRPAPTTPNLRDGLSST